MKKIIIILSISFVSTTGLSQLTDSISTADDIAVVSHVNYDSITLRWAPKTFKVWSEGNMHGYSVERYTMVRDSIVIVPEKKILLQSELLPLDRWEAIVQRNKYAAIAAQALFGEQFAVGIENTNAVAIVNKVKENEQRFSFALLSADMSQEVARASGLWFCDRDIKRNEKYFYRVLIKSDSQIFRGSAFVNPADSAVIIPPSKLSANVIGNRVDLKWQSEERMRYAQFIIEKSADSIKFHSIGDLPNVTLTESREDVNSFHYGSDSLLDSVPGYYRIRGVTLFGEITKPSNVVKVLAEVKISVPVIKEVVSIDNKQVSIVWDFPSGANKRLKGFLIERGANHHDFKIISEAVNVLSHVRRFVDMDPLSVNYYRISALSIAGEKVSSMPYLLAMVDSIPPSPPQELDAVVDDHGKLELRWARNSEPDIYGYRVYKSNHQAEEQFQLTSGPISSNVIVDKIDLRTLNNYVFYTVVAIDRNQNQSMLSRKLKVKLPDKIEPLAAVVLPATSDSSGVTVRWTRSSSLDVAHYEVYRSAEKTDQWIRLKVVDAANDSVFNFHDKFGETGKKFRYTVIAVDSSKNVSLPSSPIVGRRVDSAPSAPISWLKAEINIVQRSVKLRWISRGNNINCLKLFKSLDGGSFSLYKTIAAGRTEFDDHGTGGASCSYKMMVVFDGGRKSSLSDLLEIKF